ncbi:MAG: hypothetical protein ABR542_01980 [Desulfonatronovibrio sp.]|nr:hypothetical protein [Desulfovibrionales bacterium]
MSNKNNSKIWTKLAIVLFFTFVVCLSKVWVNIERVDLSYRMQRLQNEFRENQELRTKLTIEKNNLLSPYRLKELGEKRGLFSPEESQIRKIRNQ